jgi:Skp family chaperone for outer membrane proteins
MLTQISDRIKNFVAATTAATALVLPSTGDGDAHANPPELHVKPAVVSNFEANAERSELEMSLHKSLLQPVSDERVLQDNGTSPNLAGGAIRIQERLEDRLSRDLNYINSRLQDNKVTNLSQLADLIVETMPNLLKPNTINDYSPRDIVAGYIRFLDKRLDLPGIPDFTRYLEQLDENNKQIDDRAFEIAKHSINASAIAQNFDTALERLAATTGFKPETITQNGPLTSRLQDTVNAIIQYYTPHLYPDGNTPDYTEIQHNPYNVQGTDQENPYAKIMFEFNRLALFLGESPIEMQAFEKALQTVQQYPVSGATVQSRSIEKVLPSAIEVLKAFKQKFAKINNALSAKEEDLNQIRDAINNLTQSQKDTQSQIEELQKAFKEVQQNSLRAYLDKEESKTTEQPETAPDSSPNLFEAPGGNNKNNGDVPGLQIPDLPSQKLEGPKLIIPNSENNKREKPLAPDLSQHVSDERDGNPLPPNSV